MLRELGSVESNARKWNSFKCDGYACEDCPQYPDCLKDKEFTKMKLWLIRFRTENLDYNSSLGYEEAYNKELGRLK